MDTRLANLQRHRLRMTLLSVVNSFLQSLVIGLYAASGTIGWPTAALFAAYSLSMSATIRSAGASIDQTRKPSVSPRRMASMR